MHDLALISIVQTLGYAGLFTVIFLESGVPIGFFLPGASLLFTAGLLTSQGLFSPLILIPLVTFAAILGDSVGYWFGTRVGPALFSRPQSRFFNPDHVAHAHAFYEQYGPITVILGRFIPVVRTFVPIVAGIAGMQYTIFLRYNIAGGICFAAGVTSAGYFLGEHVPFVGEHITGILLVIIAVTTAPLFFHLRRPGVKK